MTEEALIEILQKHDSVSSGSMLIKDILSAMREAIQLEVGSCAQGITNIICEATKTPELINKQITVGEIKEMITLSMRLDSIGFMEWYNTGRWFNVGDGKSFMEMGKSKRFTTDQLYNEFLEYLKTK